MDNKFIDNEKINSSLDNVVAEVVKQQETVVNGSITRAVGLTLEGKGFSAKVGELCKIKLKNGSEVDATVTGFENSTLYLMPNKELSGIEVGSKIIPQGNSLQVPIGEQLLGRVIDGCGNPLDGLGNFSDLEKRPIIHENINPFRVIPQGPSKLF